jgi:Ca-activated chloride channel family protein
MSFLWPNLLWLAIPVLALLWRRRRQRPPAVDFPSLGLIEGGDRSWRARWHRLPDLMRALAILTLLLALARPQLEISEVSEATLGIAIELLVDVSSSMDMNVEGTDRSLTRLEAVKGVIETFVVGDGDLLTGRPDDLIGLITFARYADTVSPLTAGHDALVELVRALTIEDRPNEDGTAYGDAVALAAARLRKLDDLAAEGVPGADVASRVMVLLTDGENNCGRHLPLEATALAKEWDVRIYVISLADSMFSGGDALPDTPSAAEQILQRMAEETGGLYRRASDLDSLAAVYQEIDALEKSEIRTEHHRQWRELFPDVAALGLCLLVLEVGGRSTLFRVTP